MSYRQPIYTSLNWRLLTYLFPNGKLAKDSYSESYTVFLDVGSPAYTAKLDRLRKHSEYLATIVHSYSDVGIITFTREF